jgi:hypothetical protein
MIFPHQFRRPVTIFEQMMQFTVAVNYEDMAEFSSSKRLDVVDLLIPRVDVLGVRRCVGLSQESSARANRSTLTTTLLSTLYHNSLTP